MAQGAKELWKNVAQGTRHYVRLDPIGNQTHGVVQPGKTFTITPLERRLNQEAAYATKADMFLNGTFILLQACEDTVLSEIESDDAVSDEELEDAVRSAGEGDTVGIELMMERVESLVTAERILEELVVQDARQSLVDAAKRKVSDYTERPLGPDGKPMQIAERETIDASAPNEVEAFRQARAMRVR